MVFLSNVDVNTAHVNERCIDSFEFSNCDPIILMVVHSPLSSLHSYNMITGFFKKKTKAEDAPEPTSPLQKRAGEMKRHFVLSSDPSF